jgi:hypothetical protein
MVSRGKDKLGLGWAGVILDALIDTFSVILINMINVISRLKKSLSDSEKISKHGSGKRYFPFEGLFTIFEKIHYKCVCEKQKQK